MRPAHVFLPLRRRPLLVVAAAFFLAMFVTTVARAEPPGNDNRAAAQELGSFPADVQATLAGATVERLDPQVSNCGSVASTLWYRINAAPDGTVSITVTAAAGVAPVVRVYSSDRSAIEERSCGAAAAGGTARASFDTIRGANYLVLVGRKPSSADGTFSMHVELALPPEPPANDQVAAAQAFGRLPATVKGTTVGARGDDFDPTGDCDLYGGTVWYRMRASRDGLVMLRLHANGNLDAVVSVIRVRSGRMSFVTCRATGDEGLTSLPFHASRGASYDVVVGQQEGSRPGTFTLQAVAATPPELYPGKAMTRPVVRATLNGLTNVNDLWRVAMNPGTTYRIAFASRACASFQLRRPGRTGESIASFRCSGYRSFTPGPDGGGEYVLEVAAAAADRNQRYTLEVRRTEPDDVGVGIPMLSATTRTGSLAPRGVDLVDVYHFDIDRRSDVKLVLAPPGASSFRLSLLTPKGVVLGRTSNTLRRQLPEGRYVAAVTAPPASVGGRYRLSLLVREITRTTLPLEAKVVDLRSRVVLRPAVDPAPTGGTIELQIDRFDTLSGWQFTRMIRLHVGGSLAWTPPSAGLWRIRARFLGTGGSSPSRSVYAHLNVK